MTEQIGLIIKDKDTFNKYKTLIDDNIIKFDEDIEGITIDISEIMEYHLTKEYQFVKEIEPNMFYYDHIIIYEE